MNGRSSVVLLSLLCASGKNIAGVGSSVSESYLPSSTTPTTSYRMFPAPRKCWPKGEEFPNRTCAKAWLTTATFGVLGAVGPGNVATGEQTRTCSNEVPGRDGEVLRSQRQRSTARKIGGSIAIDGRRAAVAVEWDLIDGSNRDNARNARGFVDQAALQRERRRVGVTGHLQVNFSQHRALRRKAKRRM